MKRKLKKTAPVRLNLGAGGIEIPGFQALDGKQGDVLYPLPHAPGSVDEIRASHVLEHFPHGKVFAVLQDWASKLKPGGALRIAVPDFAVVAQQYLAGADLPIEGYVMGGQTDKRDFHQAMFDEKKLADMLRALGLLGVKRWKSEAQDCAALPISLNLVGYTPPAVWPKVSAVISMPRLGFNDFWACAYQELGAVQIPLRKVTGAYWDRDLTIGIEAAIADETPEWILTCDYDTVFNRHQVRDLLSIASRYPHADAIAPLQTARHHNAPMFTARDDEGKLLQQVDRQMLAGGEILRAETAHFGLTLLRVSALKKLPRPWFARVHDPEGGYGPEGRDPDVNFWHQWKAAGNTLYVALRVPVGHCELMIRWPNQNLETEMQRPADYWTQGAPSNLWR